MSKKSKRDRQRQEWKDLPPVSEGELSDIEHDWMVDMVGEEDAAYFEMAGIDDIGNK